MREQLAATRLDGVSGFDGNLYFRAIAAMAAADGEIRTEEAERFTALLVEAGGAPDLVQPLCRQALEHQRSSDALWFLVGTTDVDDGFARRCVRDVAVVMTADGGVHDSEQRLLDELAAALGLPEVVATEVGLAAFVDDAADHSAEEFGKEQVDAALTVMGSTAILGGGAYVLFGGGPAMMATVAAALGAGMGGWVAPALLLAGAGMASLALQMTRVFDSEEAGEA